MLYCQSLIAVCSEIEVGTASHLALCRWQLTLKHVSFQLLPLYYNTDIHTFIVVITEQGLVLIQLKLLYLVVLSCDKSISVSGFSEGKNLSITIGISGNATSVKTTFLSQTASC